MNATFNLKRFLLLEQYKMQETGKHLLWSSAIILSICILCILYDINRGGSYYGKQTSADSLYQYALWFLLAAPCLLEANLTRRSATLYMLLPASAFEKFLHIWIKYLFVLPAYCVLLIICLKGILSWSPNAYLQFFATHIVHYEIHKYQLLTIAMLHSAAFIGYFAFKQQVLLKGFAIFIACIAASMGIVLVMIAFVPHQYSEEYWLNNITSWPDTNYPLSAAAQAIISFCNYATPLCLVLGTWITSYFLLKEKQL